MKIPKKKEQISAVLALAHLGTYDNMLTKFTSAGGELQDIINIMDDEYSSTIDTVQESEDDAFLTQKTGPLPQPSNSPARMKAVLRDRGYEDDDFARMVLEYPHLVRRLANVQGPWQACAAALDFRESAKTVRPLVKGLAGLVDSSEGGVSATNPDLPAVTSDPLPPLVEVESKADLQLGDPDTPEPETLGGETLTEAQTIVSDPIAKKPESISEQLAAGVHPTQQPTEETNVELLNGKQVGNSEELAAEEERLAKLRMSNSSPAPNPGPEDDPNYVKKVFMKGEKSIFVLKKEDESDDDAVKRVADEHSLKPSDAINHEAWVQEQAKKGETT